MDISTYLRNILTKSDGEDVCDAVTDCADILNSDELTDISTEKTTVQTHPVGKVVRKAIARLLEKLARYTPRRQKIVLVTQDEYDALTDPDERTLYCIRKPERCFVVTLDDNLDYDILGPDLFLYDDEYWWEWLPGQIRQDSDTFSNVEHIGLYIGKEYALTEIEANKFEYNTILSKVVIDLESYRILDRAFFENESLRQVYLGSGITGMMPSVFQGCHDITIVINKPQGSILGAPWGAENATVLWTG